MRFSLLPTLGFSLLAMAAVVVFVTSGPSGGRGESLAGRRSSDQTSRESFRVTDEGNQQPSDFVSRSRREKKEQGLVERNHTATPNRVADRQTILAALASSPTTLSAMRPLMGHTVSPSKVALSSLSLPTATETPGNTLSTEGFLVSVESYQSTPEGEELQVHLSPSQTAASSGGGFTLEEEQFRTKWGWAAFDQVQRTAKYAAASH